jgi:glutamyl-tRNA synthetase
MYNLRHGRTEGSSLTIKAASFLALSKTLPTASAVPDIMSALESLDDHLAWRTYLVGHEITVADWAVWGAMKGMP